MGDEMSALTRKGEIGFEFTVSAQTRCTVFIELMPFRSLVFLPYVSRVSW